MKYKVETKTVLDHELHTVAITNNNGFYVELLSYGATIKNIMTKDYLGNLESVVAHPINEEFYYTHKMCSYGKTMGRTAGRIIGGKFNLNASEYVFTQDGSHIIHGGANGFWNKFFDFDLVEDKDFIEVSFKTVNKEEDDGFPGNIEFGVTYKIFADDSDILITYEGLCDSDSVLNVTNHSFFNLSGDTKSTVLDHSLLVNASKVSVPGLKREILEFKKCSEPFDFSTFKKLGKDLYNEEVQVPNGGYEHVYLFDNIDFSRVMAVAYDPVSKRKLEVFSDYDALVVYTTNTPNKTVVYGNKEIQPHDALCLEAQFVPSGINMEGVNKAIIKANEKVTHHIIFKFGLID